MIELQQLTKRYRNGRGIFDLAFRVSEGEVFGYLGPNGAGKSTTIRHLMGFMHPDAGVALIDGKDCWQDAARIQESTGYLPGEITFLEGQSGMQFLSLLAGMRRMKNTRRQSELIARFELDVHTPIRKMSKGMKQKLGIVAAFMHQPKILILDEPTSGLDPLMQQRFLALIEEEKARGATILMSSHHFAEVERVCNRVGIIKDGRLIAVEAISELRSMQRKVFDVVLSSPAEVAFLHNSGCRIVRQHENQVAVEVQGNYNDLVAALGKCNVVSLNIHELSLEQVFMHYYHGEEAKVE